MSEHLCITVRFLDGTFHGRADQGEREWPPSPLRLFQSLVAAAAALRNEPGGLPTVSPALRWLEMQAPPVIIAPPGRSGEKYRTYVPDNVGDLLAARWTRGDDGIIKRSEKDVQPTRLEGDPAVHYAWPLSNGHESWGELNGWQEAIFSTTASITHLGWGIDLVAAHAAVISEEELGALPGRRWRPVRGGGNDTPVLRVPVVGTLADLERRHAAFLARTARGRFDPVPPLSGFAMVPYADEARPSEVPSAVFSLLKPDASGYRLYDSVRDGMRVAGMLRHAAADPALGSALGWDQETVRRTVLGHTEAENESGGHLPVDGPRVAFLPLPSLEHRASDRGRTDSRHGASFTVGGVRRVLLAGTKGLGRKELQALARLFSGQTLTEEKSGQTDALLSRLPDSDPMAVRYTGRSALWTTVTPMILPGHDDRGGYRQQLFSRGSDGGESEALGPERQRELLAKLDGRIDALLRKAIRQAGFSEELARYAVLDWRNAGFVPGVAPATFYNVPQKLRRFRRLHVRIAWRNTEGDPLDVPGPLCLGGGRFVGLGLFCALKR